MLPTGPVNVIATSSVAEGVPPYQRFCTINSQTVTPINDNTFSANVTLVEGSNTITVRCAFVDALGQRTTCTHAINVTGVASPSCAVTITSPLDGASLNVKQVEVRAQVSISNGQSPVTRICTINDTAATVQPDGTFSRNVFLKPGANTIIAKCTVTDAFNRTTMCADTIRVFVPPPTCTVRITSPQEGAITLAGSVLVQARFLVRGGVEPYTRTCTINDQKVTMLDDSTFFLKVGLNFGDNEIIAACSITDTLGQSTSCSDAIHISRVDTLRCSVAIAAPQNGLVTLADSVLVEARSSVEGGLAPYRHEAVIKDLPAVVRADGGFQLKVPLAIGENIIVAATSVKDSSMQTTSCADTIRVTRVNHASCDLKITQPATGDTLVAQDSVAVVVRFMIAEGIPPYRDSTCAILVNGDSFNATRRPDSTFSAMIPLALGKNVIVALGTVKDRDATNIVCVDTVRVYGRPISCSLAFISHTDSAFVCSASEKIVISHQISDTLGLLATTGTINGVAATLRNGSFWLPVALQPGFNTIIAESRSTFTRNREAVCRDTLVLFSDTTPPVCAFDLSRRPTIIGKATDFESGIASIEILNLQNGEVRIDSFKVGAREVNFVAQRVGTQGGPSFTLRIKNRAGCVIECDPILVRVEPGVVCDHSFTMPHTDRYLRIDNHGVKRIILTLNQTEITLSSDSTHADRICENYYMPLYGFRFIDLAKCLMVGENSVRVRCEGEAGSYAELFFSDIEDDNVHTRVEEREPSNHVHEIPKAFALYQNYPNPFNLSTTIVFDVPEAWHSSIKLMIHNARGQLVRNLFEGLATPGRHVISWDGHDEGGRPISSGVYFCRIISEKTVMVKKMVLAK